MRHECKGREKVEQVTLGGTWSEVQTNLPACIYSEQARELRTRGMSALLSVLLSGW